MSKSEFLNAIQSVSTEYLAELSDVIDAELDDRALDVVTTFLINKADEDYDERIYSPTTDRLVNDLIWS